MKFCTLTQNDNVENVTEPDFCKKKFLVENAGKTGYLAFSRDFIISFFRFFAQRCVLAMPKMWPSWIFEKKFFPPENAGNIPEIAVFADFVRVFSSYFVVFSHKNIINSNTHHQECFNCQKNLFLKPELSKNRRNSQFSPEKRYFLNISSLSLIHISEPTRPY